MLLVVINVVAFAPPLLFDAWTIRFALVLATAFLGVAMVVAHARRGDRAALLLFAALIWTVFVSAVSGAPRSALLGSVGRDLSALTVIASLASWPVGRAMSARGRALLPSVLAASCAVNAAVGLLQVLADVDTGDLALYFARPTGFSVNPVYYGALSVVGLIVAVDRWSRQRWAAWTLAVFVLGVGVTVSGSRVALGAAVVLVGARLATRRTPDTAIAAAASFVAMSIGVIIDRAAGAGRNAADRLTSGGGGGRTAVWRYGTESFADRPLVGFGFGRFRAAVQSRFSVDFVRVSAPDDLGQAWFDAHNALIMLLVAVGAVGTVLFLTWAVVWGRRIRGPLAWACAAFALHWMLQPVSMVTLPIFVLAFGAAGVVQDDDAPAARIGRRAAIALVAIGSALAGALVAGDVLLQRAVTSTDPALAQRTAAIYMHDPVVSDVVAQVIAADRSDLTDDELRWRRRATEAEPDRPYWWTQLAAAYVRRDRLDDAERSVERALDLQPTNVRALRTLAIISIARGDAVAVADAFDRLCALGQPECDVDPVEVVAPHSP